MIIGDDDMKLNIRGDKLVVTDAIKAYIDETLLFLEKEINQEDDYFGFKYLFDKPLEEVCFEDKFKMYRETTNNEVENR